LGLSALAWACAIGPLYGILLVDYYVIKKEQIDLYSMSPNGRTGTGRGESESGKCANFGVYDRLYFYHGTSFNVAQGFSLFIRAGLAALFYFVLARSTAMAAAPYQRPG
jgi:cytosine/uracil/thiamine/allantoin permease